MTTRNSEISIAVSGGSVESTKKEILLSETNYHNVARLYEENAVGWTALHFVRRLFVMRYWKNNLFWLGFFIIGVPILRGFIFDTVNNGVEVRAGVRGIGVSNNSSEPPVFIQTSFYGKK